MARIPAKCPKCGRTKAWQEEVNAFKSGIPAGPFGRIRICVPRGILAGLFKKAAGCYRVTYRCKKCGHREEYELDF